MQNKSNHRFSEKEQKIYDIHEEKEIRKVTFSNSLTVDKKSKKN